MDPVALAHEFAARAEQQGVEFREQTPVTDIELSEGTVSAVIADGESITTSQVICAAGPWNPQMADTIGLELPVSHTLGSLFRLDASLPSQCTLPAIVNEDSGAFCRSDFDGTYLLGHRPRNPDAPDQYDPDTVVDEVPDGLYEQALDSMAELLPFIADADIVDEQVAVRSSVRDNRPVVGWTSIPGFSVAAFESSSIQLATAVGDIITRQLVNGGPTKFYDAVSISRFEGYADTHTLIRNILSNASRFWSRTTGWQSRIWAETRCRCSSQTSLSAVPLTRLHSCWGNHAVYCHNDFGFINAVGNPADLIGLGIHISKYLVRWASTDNTILVYIDSITALLQFAELNDAYRFLHVLSGRIKSVDGHAVYRASSDGERHSTGQRRYRGCR